VIVGVAGAGTKVVRGWNFLEAETGISKRTLGYSLALVVGTRLSTRAVADLGGESGQHDEHPNEPEQREESDPSSAPINRAECVQAQTDQACGTEHAMNATLNSHVGGPHGFAA